MACYEHQICSIHEAGVEARRLEAEGCSDAAPEGEEAGAGILHAKVPPAAARASQGAHYYLVREEIHAVSGERKGEGGRVWCDWIDWIKLYVAGTFSLAVAPTSFFISKLWLFSLCVTNTIFCFALICHFTLFYLFILSQDDLACLVVCSLQWKIVQLPVVFLLCTEELHFSLGGEDEGHCWLAAEEGGLHWLVATVHTGNNRGHGGHKPGTAFQVALQCCKGVRSLTRGRSCTRPRVHIPAIVLGKPIFFLLSFLFKVF